MTSYRPGEVVLLVYPFTSVEGRKKRPALVLVDTGDDDVIVARITSHITHTAFDVELTAWRQAGLVTWSVVRVHKLATLEKKLIERTLGALSTGDWERVRAKIQQLWAIDMRGNSIDGRLSGPA